MSDPNYTLKEVTDDLEWARIRSQHTELAPRVACFLAHLVAEKSVKGMLVAEPTILRSECRS